MEPTLEQPSIDVELHRRLVYGDESALRELYAAYGGLVRRVAVRVTRSPAAAEDVAQEVFAQLWSRPYGFDARRGSLRTWLSMVAHRRAVDWVRGEARHRKDARADDSALHAIPDTGPGPAEAVVDRERSLELHTALAELPRPSGKWSTSPTSRAAPTARPPSNWAYPRAPRRPASARPCANWRSPSRTHRTRQP